MITLENSIYTLNWKWTSKTELLVHIGNLVISFGYKYAIVIENKCQELLSVH
uniref:Uncharacterized protein n=1 Tax=Arundo donax TaxID=35708 RepID=A0A0A9AAG5_ARUDO